MKTRETVRERDEEALEKKWCEDVQLPANFEQHSSAFLQMLTKFGSMRDVNHGSMSLKHRIDPTNDEVGPVHYASFRGGQKERQFAAPEKPHDQWEVYRPNKYKIGGTYCVYEQKRRLNLLLRRLQEVKYRHHTHTRFMPRLSYERLYRQLGRGGSVFSTERQDRLSGNWDQQMPPR